MKKVRRAAAVAAVSGWSMAAFAGLTGLGALFGSVTSLAVAAALGAIAWNELRGGAMLRRLDPRGAARLGWNQVALGGLIVGYAAWSLATASAGSALEAMGGTTGDAGVDAMITDLTRTANLVLYSVVGAAGVIVPGLTALYYFTRGRIVRDAAARTPGWVVEAVRAAA